jgi:hypothetical protein
LAPEPPPEGEVKPALQEAPFIRKTLTARQREIALLVCDEQQLAIGNPDIAVRV